jgi:hypothetical protein
MAKADKGTFEVGFGKPPRSRQFKPGQSGNPAGRPRGAKNFATAIKQELAARVTITENGTRKRISKRQVIAKYLVNKAASGDLKAIPLVLSEERAREGNRGDAGADEILGTAEDRKVFDSAIARIRSSLPDRAASPIAEESNPEGFRPPHETGE